MTAALVILSLVLAAAGGTLVFVLRRYVPRADVEAAAADARRGFELGQRLASVVEQAQEGERRALAIADERRAEANELRVELSRRAHAELVGERVVVTTVDGHSIEGDLERLYSDGFLLSRAHYLTGEGPSELGGYITIREANVSFIQRPGAAEASA